MCHTGLLGMLEQRWEKMTVSSHENSFELFRLNPFPRGVLRWLALNWNRVLCWKKRSETPLFLAPLCSFSALKRLCLGQLSKEEANALGCGCRCSMWETSHHRPKPKRWTEIEIKTSTCPEISLHPSSGSSIFYPVFPWDLTFHMHCSSSPKE